MAKRKIKIGTRVRLVGAGTGKQAVKGKVIKVHPDGTYCVDWGKWGIGRKVERRALKISRRRKK